MVRVAPFFLTHGVYQHRDFEAKAESRFCIIKLLTFIYTCQWKKEFGQKTTRGQHTVNITKLLMKVDEMKLAMPSRQSRTVGSNSDRSANEFWPAAAACQKFRWWQCRALVQTRTISLHSFYPTLCQSQSSC